MASYRGKDLKTFFTSQLEAILKGLKAAEEKRNEASKHTKFDKSNKKGMEFPPPNPAFLELKSAIEEELVNRKKNNA